MSPTLEDWNNVTQILKYLVGTYHYVLVLEPAYRLAELPKTLDVVTYADSDWAGCKLTRKSTSGIVVQLLGTTVLFASRTQESVARSSGEAELYAVGSTVSEGLFVTNFLKIDVKVIRTLISSSLPSSSSSISPSSLCLF